MNYRTSLLAMGVLGTTFCLSAQGVFSYSGGDVVAAFSKAGSPDFIVNLGSVSQFTGQAPGYTADLTLKYTVDGANLLNANFGGSTVGVSLALFGITTTTIPNQNPVFVSLVRPDALTQSTPYKDVTPSTVQGYVSRTSGLLGNATSTGILAYSPDISATLTSIPADDVNSYTKRQDTSLFAASFPNSQSGPATAGADAYVDLYQVGKSALVPKPDSQFLGYFSLNGAGAVAFAVSPVPEPEEYALAFGGLALAGAVLRRKFKK